MEIYEEAKVKLEREVEREYEMEKETHEKQRPDKVRCDECQGQVIYTL